MGRPPIPKKLHKASLLSVRFSAEERRAIDRAAENRGVGLSTWARDVILAAVSSSPAPLPAPAQESPSEPR